MALTNLTTATKTTAVLAGLKPTVNAADRLGLGFAFAPAAYPADTLSHDPVPEQVRSRQEQSAPQMQPQMRPDGSDVVPPAGSTGCLPPGSRAVVAWSFPPSASWSETTTDTSRSRVTVVSASRVRTRRDCQSPARNCDKRSLPRDVVSAATAGK